MKWLAAFLAPLLVATLALACGEEEEEAPTAIPSPAATLTPLATPTAVTDGQFPIAYSDDEQGDMWVVPADGIGKQNVTMGRCPHPSQFYFSPQGDRFACIASANDGKTEMRIFLLDAGGYPALSSVTRDGLFAGFSWPGMADESPSSLWSSSQQYMAYVLEQGPPPGTPHLYISEAAGIRKEIPGGQQPRWSAEGDRIAYNQPPDDTLVLYEPHTGDEKALGTGLRPLAWVLNDTSLLVAANAKVDPQFYTDRLTYEANLLDLTSGEMTRVPQLDNSARFWLSPDRTKSAVQRQGQPLGALDLATLRFTSIAPAEGRSYSVPSGYDPRRQLTFTPDGSRIYWFGTEGAIYSASSDGTGLTELWPTHARRRFLGFSPDATQVLLLTVDAGSGLWVANVDGSDRHLMTDKTPSDAAWGPWASLTEPVTIDGARVVPLNSAKGAEFPDDVALIVEATCRACDGPSSGLYLVYRDASGQVRMDELFADETLGLPLPAMSTPTATGPYGPYIHSLALSSDASDIVIDVCTRGRCDRTGIAEASPDAQSTLYRSTDGGVTWEELGVLDGSHYVEAITNQGLVVSARGPETEWKPKYQLFPSGEPLEPPPGAGEEKPLALPDGDLAWPTDDGRLLRGDGSQFLTVSQGRTVPDTVRNIVPDASGERLAVASRRGLGLFSRDGQPIRLFECWEFPGVGAWLSDTVFAGNVSLPPTAPPDSDDRYTVPVIFDLEAGERHRILDAFLGPPRFSYVVRAALLGPFARVVNTGACLNVRAEPAIAADALTCAADGVLLRDTGETREVEGVTWCRVVTPAGVEGWASAQYLER